MTTTPRPFIRPNVRRALAAEPGLQAIEQLVDALCVLVRPSDRMCYSCVWEDIIKPLAAPLIGWERPPKSETDTEAWLCTSQAWDAVTDHWLDRLEAADPGNGHGLGRHVE